MVSTSIEPETPTSMSYEEFKNKIVAVSELSPNDVEFEKILNQLNNIKYITYPSGTIKNVKVVDALREANDEFRNYTFYSSNNQSDVVEVANSLIYQHGWGNDDPDRSEDGDPDISEDGDPEVARQLDFFSDLESNADDATSQDGGKAKRKSMKKTKKSKRKHKNKKSTTKSRKHINKRKSSEKKRNTKTMRKRKSTKKGKSGKK